MGDAGTPSTAASSEVGSPRRPSGRRHASRCGAPSGHAGADPRRIVCTAAQHPGGVGEQTRGTERGCTGELDGGTADDELVLVVVAAGRDPSAFEVGPGCVEVPVVEAAGADQQSLVGGDHDGEVVVRGLGGRGRVHALARGQCEQQPSADLDHQVVVLSARMAYWPTTVFTGGAVTRRSIGPPGSSIERMFACHPVLEPQVKTASTSRDETVWC